MSRLSVLSTALMAAVVVCATGVLAQQPPSNTAGIEFFEKRIRPVLAANCYQCHTPEKKRAGLLLDSLEGILKGGDRGPAIVPNSPDESLLIRAVRYGDEPRMPPKGKLSEQQIADLTAWVKLGAPGPKAADRIAAGPKGEFDLAERRKHWAYQPVRDVPAPAVKNAAWCASPVDFFVMAGLEKAALSPAPAADRRALIRRVTFDLIGLPPTPTEVDAFLADNLPKAFEKVVDRLLASPHYGERWGRHWLDLVRYAETHGFEFDYDLYHAWRYRDYVIRAFNDDLPYNQFIIEHLAGDLLTKPRVNKADGANESILATGFFWMGEARQTPIDIRQEQADVIDHQLDVVGKAFLAQTIACARCHDHKFDAISTRDYYSLVGYIRSSRYQQAQIDAPERISAKAKELSALRAKIVELIQSDWAKQARSRLETAVVQTLPASPSAHAASQYQRFEDFRRPSFEGWNVTGDAFGAGPARNGDIVLGDSADKPVTEFLTTGANSALLSNRLQGELRSKTFTIEQNFVHFRLAGRAARVNLVVDGNTLIMNPIYGNLTIALPPGEAKPKLEWRTMPVDRWVGHQAYIEILDNNIPMHRLNPPPSTATMPVVPPDGYISVNQIVFSNDAEPPTPNVQPQNLKASAGAESPATVVAANKKRMIEVFERWRAGKAEDNDVDLLNWMLQSGLLDADKKTGRQGDKETGREFAELFKKYREIEASIPLPQRAPAMADGTGEDEFVSLRGNYKTPGELAPRGLPVVLANGKSALRDGSGRLDLAQKLVDPSNPLVARVLVNRLWQHHFGEGIVRTPDDFGRMGQAPTHPELLDYLATEFIRRGWSIKQMHRVMLLSSTYQMSCQSDPSMAKLDPENRLLQHMNIRRLEGEAIRDSILAVSGRLDHTLYGPSVLPHLTSHMEGRGKPTTGPLDGAGRRSIYLNVRRNFLTPLLVAFDYPISFDTTGRRGLSSAPAQALTLLNDPFVVEQASLWAKRTLADPNRSQEQRVEALYKTAFARTPTKTELSSALDFLERQASRYQGEPDDPRAWADLCHVLMNLKEFIFLD